MDLKEKLKEDMKTAMKSGNKEKLSVIRMMLSKIKQIEIDDKTVLGDDKIIDILSSSVKKSRDAVEQFKKGGREDLAAKENNEIEIIQSYLPEALTEEELSSVIDKTIQEVQANGIKDMGKVMKVIVPKIKGRADSGHVSALIKQRLNG